MGAASASEAAAYLGLSERHFFRLVAEGVLPERGADGWDPAECSRRYLEDLRARALLRGAEPDELGIERPERASPLPLACTRK